MNLSEIMMDEAKKLGFTEEQVKSADLYARATNPIVPGGMNRDSDLPEDLEDLIRWYMRLHLIKSLFSPTSEETIKAAKDVERKIQNN